MYLETEGKISQAVPNFLKHYYFRSSHLRCSVKKIVLRIFAKFTGKHLCQRFYFSKIAGQAYNFIKKSLWYRYFPTNFAKFLRTTFLQNTSGRLLLNLLTILNAACLKLIRIKLIKSKHKRGVLQTRRISYFYKKSLHLITRIFQLKK